MEKEIIMPKLGESITEGTIIKWIKKIGETVEKDENILIISTDKVEAEIPSPASGILLSISVKEGETVDVGSSLGYIIEEDKCNLNEEKKVNLNKNITQKNESNEIFESKVKHNSKSSSIKFLSPLVKNIMKKHLISENEIKHLNGTGSDNRINKNDILNFIKNKNKLNYSLPEIKDNSIKEISTMRKAIMKNMILSRKISAHVTTFFNIDYTKIDIIRNNYKSKFLKEEGVSLTYTSFLIAALCKTLKKHPYLNSEIKNNTIIFKKHINLGVAVSISNPEPGLIVPVIKNCDQMNLRGISVSIHNLAKNVRNKTISYEQLSGGTFTISNPGNYGAIIGTPIINQPQVAVLGIGKIQKNPIILNIDNLDVIAIRNTGNICLSFDHRLIDGATADIFMSDLKNTLENWSITP